MSVLCLRCMYGAHCGMESFTCSCRVMVFVCSEGTQEAGRGEEKKGRGKERETRVETTQKKGKRERTGTEDG